MSKILPYFDFVNAMMDGLFLATLGCSAYSNIMGKNNQKTYTLAVASGKGGVGKTTTSVNLALFYSRRGLKTLLIDADPLSDVTTVLDISTPEENIDSQGQLSVQAVFKMLDLLIPGDLRNPVEVGNQLNLVISDKKILTQYEIVIIDLPAGILAEEGWAFASKIDKMVIVTNDEPTSHVASGAFIGRAKIEEPSLSYRIWHNKYQGIGHDGFDPKDLAANYNRNVAEEDQIDFGTIDMTDIAFIPQDPALDLLQASPDLNLNIKRLMLERVELLYRDRIAQILGIAPLSSRIATLMENMLFEMTKIDSVEIALKSIASDVSSLFGGGFFNAEERKDLKIFAPKEEAEIRQIIKLLKDDNLSHSLRRIRRVLIDILEDEEASQRLFHEGTADDKLKRLDREISLLLGTINEKVPRGGTTIKNLGGLLLFDFTLFKLFGSSTVRQLIEDFIPWKENGRGGRSRDKNSQIRWLIEKDDSYRMKYLTLIKTLRPVVISQLKGIASALEVEGILFKKQRKVDQEVYLRLLTAFLHDVVNSGLGVIIGFKYRPASRAFQRGALRLMEEMELKDTKPEKVKIANK